MKNMKGFTLVELMISIIIGLLVLTGAIQFYLNVFRSNYDGVRLQRFEQTAHILAETMVSDLRRAGYEYNDVTTGTTVILTKQSNNKFFYAEPSGKCILFNYSNKDPVDNVWKQYFYGYQLNNKVVYYYESNTANGSCSNLSGWEALTDLTQISFTNTSGEQMFVHAGTALINIHMLAQAIGLTAQGGGTVNRDLTVSVHVRNN